MATIRQLAMMGVKPIEYKPKMKRQPKGRDLVGIVVNLGAGVQSSTLIEMIVEGELPPVDLVIFADTGDEPPWVYNQVAYLAMRLSLRNIPLIRVAKDGPGIVENAMYGHFRFATMPLFTKGDSGKKGQMRRQCTKEFKIQPINNYLLDWMVEHGHGKRGIDKNGRDYRRVSTKVYIEQWYGISMDEIERMKDRGAGWQKAIYPLIDKGMKRSDCIAWLKSKGLPIPDKSSCVVCPFHDDLFWYNLSVNYPPVFEHACIFDDWLRTPEASERFTRNMRQDVYLHRSCEPLRTINFRERVKLPLFEANDICGAHCNT